MTIAGYVRWQDGNMWLGYFEQFPDYLTQGQSLSHLEENLRDVYRDLTSGEIPGIRCVAACQQPNRQQSNHQQSNRQSPRANCQPLRVNRR